MSEEAAGQEDIVKARLLALDNCDKAALAKTCFVLGENGKTTFVLGRHTNADCLIKDVNVSRRHASFTYQKSPCPAWSVVDHKSMNGIALNGNKIKPEEPKALKDGDIVSIETAYSWSFEFPAKNETEETGNSTFRGRSSFISAVDAKLQEALSKISRDKEELDLKVREGEIKQLELTGEKEALAKKLEEERLAFAKKQEEERSTFEAKLSASNEQRQEFERRLAEEQKAMEANQLEASLQLEEQIKASEAKMKAVAKEREEMAERMEAEKAKVQGQMVEMRRKFEEQVGRLESAFKSEKATSEEYKAAMDKLDAEFREQLKREQSEFEKKMAEAKAKERAEKERLAQELETKKEEIAKLAKELDDQKRKRQEEEVTSRKKVKADFMAQCNSELKCSVCDELFIEPLSLNCGHVYCQFCIDQWKSTCTARKGAFTCPNCRQVITNTTKSIHLQNLIESLYADASQDIKTERQQVVAERKDAEKQANRKPLQPKQYQAGGGGRRNNAQATAAAAAAAVRAQQQQQQQQRQRANQPAAATAAGARAQQPPPPRPNHHRTSYPPAAAGAALPRLPAPAAAATGAGANNFQYQTIRNPTGGTTYRIVVPALQQGQPQDINIGGQRLRVFAPPTATVAAAANQSTVRILTTAGGGNATAEAAVRVTAAATATTTASPARLPAVMVDGRAVPVINVD